jgi:glycosyltransferase involved in cell wall biosynthesis
MLVGLPCVTTDVGSIGELALDGTTALVVPPENVAALRGALQRLIAEPELRDALGDAARRHCAERMSLERMLDSMEAIYREAARSYLER